MDLHIHTPGSTDYQEPDVGYLEILQKAEARGLDIIAFTDHNSVAGYAALQRDIARLEFLEATNRLLPDEARRLAEYRRLLERVLVLPGFEFTATFGFHILGIFPETTSVRQLEHLLLELNVPEEKLDRGTSEVGATTDVLNAYQVIAGAGGLVIGAHVNSTHGIAMVGLGFGGQTKIAYTQDPNLHALEVTDLENTSRRATARFFNGSKPEYPRRMHCIQGSDAHRLTRDPQRPDKSLGIGDRCTEVLLPDVSFAALKALFTANDFSRERPYRPSEDPFDPVKAARSEGNTIVQSFHESPGVPRSPVKGLLKDIVGFANTNGGTIFIGASADPAAPIRGVDGARELTEAIRAEAAREIVPPLTPEIETLTSDGKTVVMVTVPRGTEPPYALQPGYIYVRQEGETVLALRDEIVQLVRAALVSADVAPETLASPATLPAALLPPAPPPPAPRPAPERPERQDQVSQRVAVRQASAAEQERQRERTPVPRTGVEIVASTDRNGVYYHTVRDLRNRRVIRNVTRESARRLWRYAIVQSEEHPVRAGEVSWDERDPRFGYWKGYRQPEGMCRYNLIYREQPAQEHGDGERLRVFYGVTEDGMDERWRGVLPPEETLPVLDYEQLPVGVEAREPFAPSVESQRQPEVTPPAVVATPTMVPPPAPETGSASAAPIDLPGPPETSEAPAPAPKRRRAPRRTTPASEAASTTPEASPTPAGLVAAPATRNHRRSSAASRQAGAPVEPVAVTPATTPEAPTAGAAEHPAPVPASSAPPQAETPVKRPTRRRRVARAPVTTDDATADTVPASSGA